MDYETPLLSLRLVSFGANQRTLAQKLGFSIGKTNYVLKALIDKGLVKAERFAHAENKLNYRYALTPEGIQQRFELTEKFIKRKQQEYLQLTQELEQLKQLKHHTPESHIGTDKVCLSKENR